MTHRNPKNKGFTLIELLVVISIIGLLSSVVLASLGSARTRARDARTISAIGQYQIAMELYYSDNGKYPSPTDTTPVCLGTSCLWNGANMGAGNGAITTGLTPYITGTPPPNTQTVVVGAANYQGAIYRCSTFLSGNCTSGLMQWPEGKTTCTRGTKYAGDAVSSLCYEYTGGTSGGAGYY